MDSFPPPLDDFLNDKQIPQKSKAFSANDRPPWQGSTPYQFAAPTLAGLQSLPGLEPPTAARLFPAMARLAVLAVMPSSLVLDRRI